MTSRLLAIKMMRQTTTAAVYFGRELHYVEVRQLASDLGQAKDSLIAFTSSLIEHFRIDSAASEKMATDTRAKALTGSMLDRLREMSIPHWTIEKSQVFEAYGEIPIKSLHELRDIVANYWPHIIDEYHDRSCLDAAALGLFWQTERMLSDNSPPSP